MAVCTRCSSTLTDADRFCPRCGAPSGSAPDASSARTLPATTPSPRPPSDPSSLGHGRFEPGTRLGTRYRVVGLLGRGGMGEVYRADDLELGQSVALKFLPERLRRDPETLARFRNEVRLARQIAHPNVGRVYDIGEADGEVFLTMEYVDGEDLASVLRRMGRPSRDKAIEIARQLCLGLAAAHERGVLHRDLKPSNVMIDGRGRVRVMDFGLAALADDSRGEQPVVGTPAYMAPEQLASGQVSVQSDLYALGLVIYELFTGRRVNETSDPAELARRHAAGSVPTPSSVVDDMDPVIERVVLRCLESDPRNRPASAYAVLGALPGGDPLAAALAAGETPSPELVAQAGESGGLRPLVAVSLLVAALACVCVSMALMTPRFRDLHRSPEALSFKAGAILESLGYDHLAVHTASGFGVRGEWVQRLAERHLPADSLASQGPGAVFFWRRYSSRRLDPRDIHRSVVQLADPALAGGGSISVLLDTDGRLLGLCALPTADSAATASGPPRWGTLLAQAGLDSSRLARDPRPWSCPIASDSGAAWTLAAARPGAAPWTVRAAARHGRVVYFAIGDSLGSATGAALSGGPSSDYAFVDWLNLSFWVALCIGGIVLARRNLRLGRGDRRGAFRLAVFVFVATALETVFTWSLPENGPPGLIDSIFSDKALGHALLHSMQMWVAYVAIEPYVRRIWPRMLVSWARLASGRPRDPMVGRDALVGLLLGGAAMLALQLGTRASLALHAPTPLDVPTPAELAAYGSLGGLGFGLAFNLSVTVLDVLNVLVTCLLVHLLTRNERGTFVVAGAISTVLTIAVAIAPDQPWPVLQAVVTTVMMFVALFRFGLLTALVGTFTLYVLGSSAPPFDPGAWYGGRGMLVLAVFVVLLGSAFWTALAGQSLVADPLQERKPARG